MKCKICEGDLFEHKNDPYILNCATCDAYYCGNLFIGININGTDLNNLPYKSPFINIQSEDNSICFFDGKQHHSFNVDIPIFNSDLEKYTFLKNFAENLIFI